MSPENTSSFKAETKAILEQAAQQYGDMNFIEAFRLTRKAAELGDPKAILLLAEEYRHGGNVPKNETEADRLRKLGLSLVNKAASQGDIEATLQLAQCYDFGMSLPQNKVQALQYYQRAADAGSIVGLIGVADILRSGDSGVDQDQMQAGRLYAEALRHYRAAAATGDRIAKRQLFQAYYHGELGVERNFSEAIAILKELADSNDSYSILILGQEYVEGRVLPKNLVEAVRLYRRAAELGNSRAMYELGERCATGNGISKDSQEAARWYQRAADLGDTQAMTSLGEMYEQGHGLLADYTAAVNLYRQAADAGYPYAIVRLGAMYKFGRGVAQDNDEAQRLRQRAQSFFATVGNGYQVNEDFKVVISDWS